MSNAHLPNHPFFFGIASFSIFITAFGTTQSDFEADEFILAAGAWANVTAPRRVRGIIKSVPFYFPRFEESDFESLKPWQGLRPCSPDGLPYIGRTKRYDNLTIAAGQAMMGLSLAPVIGKLISQLLTGEKTAVDLKLLDVDRFA